MQEQSRVHLLVEEKAPAVPQFFGIEMLREADASPHRSRIKQSRTNFTWIIVLC